MPTSQFAALIALTLAAAPMAEARGLRALVDSDSPKDVMAACWLGAGKTDMTDRCVAFRTVYTERVSTCMSGSVDTPTNAHSARASYLLRQQDCSTKAAVDAVQVGY